MVKRSRCGIVHIQPKENDQQDGTIRKEIPTDLHDFGAKSGRKHFRSIRMRAVTFSQNALKNSGEIADSEDESEGGEE